MKRVRKDSQYSDMEISGDPSPPMYPSSSSSGSDDSDISESSEESLCFNDNFSSKESYGPGCNAARYNNDGDYCWDVKINSVAKAMKNVLNFPKHALEECLLWSQQRIEMLDLDTGRPYGCEILKAKRDEDEKFIWNGWTGFARRRQLKRGDVVHLTLVNPYDRLTVSITKRLT